jgi:hypothetical protein
VTDIPYLVRVRGDLVSGIGRRQRRLRARRRRAALAIGTAALVVAVAAASLPGGSSPALAIEPEGDWIQVRIADIAASEAEMESELRAAGIDADIRLVPMTPDYVGQWACITSTTTAPIDPSSELTDPPHARDPRQTMRFTPEALYIQRGSAEQLVIVAGRAPEGDEQPYAWPEPCHLIKRLPDGEADR